MEQVIFKPSDGYDIVKFAQLSRPMEVFVEVYATLRILTEDNKEKFIPYATTKHHSVVCKNEYSLCYHGSPVGALADYTPTSPIDNEWSFEVLREDTGLNIFLQLEQDGNDTKLYLCANADLVDKIVFRTVKSGATCDVLPVSGATFGDLKIIRDDTSCLFPKPHHVQSSDKWHDGFPFPGN